MENNAVYLTPAELSARWKGKPKVSTLRTWRCQKIGPDFVKIGKSVLYPLPAIEEFERSNGIRAKAAG